MSRFARTFTRLRGEGACGLFPYLMAGFPDVPTSHALAVAALEAGADGFEIGVPFSDPLADGATQQRVNSRPVHWAESADSIGLTIRARYQFLSQMRNNYPGLRSAAF